MNDSIEDERPTLASVAYLQLRDEIIRAELPPGTKLNMRVLCDRFGVSLSPMREALSRLASDGLVTQSAQRGFAVAHLTLDGLDDLIRARCWVNELGLRKSIAHGDSAWEENLVLALHRMNRIPRVVDDPLERTAAWSKAHMEFHRALVCASGSGWITRFCDELFEAAERYRYFARRANREQSIGADEHEMITSAAISRDADRAVALLNAHFQKTADRVRQVLAANTTTEETAP